MTKKNIKQKSKGVSVEELFNFIDKLQEKSKKDVSIKKIFETASQKWDAHINACN